MHFAHNLNKSEATSKHTLRGRRIKMGKKLKSNAIKQTIKTQESV